MKASYVRIAGGLAVGLGSLLGVLGNGPVACSQETDPQEWQEYADSRPFPTSHIRIPKWRLTDGPHVRSAFRTVIAQARPATVLVRNDGTATALGGIVGADGLILTKASRLPGKITCLLADQREREAAIIAVDPDYDLALLKIDAQALPTLPFSNSPPPAIGAWLATVGMKGQPPAVGVMSVASRQISRRAGTLGVLFDDRTDKPVVEKVFPGTGAAAAGLESDDELLSIDGTATPTRRTFIQRVRAHSPGEQIKLAVRRGDQTLQLVARLKGQAAWRSPTREEFQNELGGGLSQRRGGFPVAFQHDTVIKPSECGGPIVDLNGQVVGFNLARAGRTETYAIPSQVLLEVISELKSDVR